MRYTYAALFVLLICAVVAFAGCTGTTGSAGATGSGSSGTSASGGNLAISPTDVIPETNQVTVTVQEKVYDGTIPVVFNGGKGQNLVSSIDVTLYRSDGQVQTAKIGKNKGDEANPVLVGTKDPNNPDRVVVYVSEMNGQRYKVADVLVDYRQH
jgi:hypothetical protein